METSSQESKRSPLAEWLVRYSVLDIVMVSCSSLASLYLLSVNTDGNIALKTIMNSIAVVFPAIVIYFTSSGNQNVKIKDIETDIGKLESEIALIADRTKIEQNLNEINALQNFQREIVGNIITRVSAVSSNADLLNANSGAVRELKVRIEALLSSVTENNGRIGTRVHDRAKEIFTILNNYSQSGITDRTKEINKVTRGLLDTLDDDARQSLEKLIESDELMMRQILQKTNKDDKSQSQIENVEKVN